MNKIAILMSTYNGENFIREQLDSIIAQKTTLNWVLYIRDDGSKDKTRRIIEEYQLNDSRIQLLSDRKNIGLVNSFLKLLKEVDADYYMFSDQDDYWKNDKVKKSIECISKMDNLVPCLVHTDLEVVDKDLNILNEKMKVPPYLRSLEQLSFVNNVTGCTMVINQKLKEKVLNNLKSTSNIVVHDWWITLVASCFGNINYLNETTIKYRQHSNNVLGSSRKKKGFYQKLIQKLSGNGGFIKDVGRLLRQLIKFSEDFSNNKDHSDFLNDIKRISNSHVLFRIYFLMKYRIVMETVVRTVEFYLIFIFLFKRINLKEGL
ncbi:glycosyltransferase family 2 protein [Latilactobacillus sakei]|uniref:glycosyltransferase family 2 protein n=1 Tax=Latilactobacillus sakei TaxID=1599 RepID=UPI00232E381C|nr:glycosyltransferase family 2 protein [Latilactobacillus sakei]MDB1553431.1 glycosyltransferase family 2 protein [Latilactobacillus sakei]